MSLPTLYVTVWRGPTLPKASCAQYIRVCEPLADGSFTSCGCGVTVGSGLGTVTSAGVTFSGTTA